MELVVSNVSYKVLNKVSIKVMENKITGILGANGSGKSLLAEIIATLRKPTEGKMILGNNLVDFTSKFINYSAVRFDIGIVMQNIDKQLFSNTVKEHISFQLKQYNYKNNEKRINQALVMVGLNEKYISKKLLELSDGERFLVSLAGVLALNPSVIILDDPVAFLDDKYSALLIKLLKRIKNKYNKTILVLSNNSDLIHSIADYIYILYKGKIVLEGNKYDVFGNSKLEKYSIKIPDVIKVAQIVRKNKRIKLPYRDDVNDLIKDIYFYKEKSDKK